jgi:SSS family transporter
MFDWTELASPREIIGPDEFRLAVRGEDLLAVPSNRSGAVAAITALDGRWRRASKEESRKARTLPEEAAKLWESLPAIPELFEQPAALAIGPSHVVLIDRHDIDRSLAYHTITGTWRDLDLGLDETALERKGRAPAEIVSWRGGIVIAGDEAIFFGEPQRATQGLSSIDTAVLIAYLLLLTLMGFYFARRGRRSEDYFLAGRRIPWWAAGISLLGTSISAITFMAIPALVYRTDWVYLIGNLMIVAVAPPVIAYYLPFYRRLKVTSAYEYLELRFGLATRLVGSATFLLYQMGRMGIVVYLPALALAAVTGWNVYLCIIAIGVLATLYTTLGGIEAVIWTDVVQVVVLLGGAVASLFVIISLLPGGPAGLIETAAAEGKLTAVNLGWSASTTALWVVVFGNFFKFLIPYSSDQAVIQRYLTTSDEKQAARSIWLNAAASIPVWTTFFALGTALWAFYRAFPEKLDVVGKTDEIFAWFIVHELPTGLTGLVVAALFAAAMSSLDSGMNSMATAITTDFYRRFRPAANDRSCLNAARLATVLLGLTATGLAAYLASVETGSIWDRFLEIMGLFGGGLAGMFMAGIFTRRTHQTGILVGFAASAMALYFARASGAVHFFLYGAIGIFTCAVVGWLASRFLAGPDRDLTGLTIHSKSH